MNKLMTTLVLSFVLCTALAQKHSEILKEEISVQNAASAILFISNINGSISLEGYDGDKIIFEVEKTIEAENTADLQQGKAEMGVNFETRGDSVFTFLKGPFDVEFKWGSWRYTNSWNDDSPYDYQFDFTVKVPKNMSVKVSTVNKGDVYVENIQPKVLHTNNVNGKITLKNVSGTTRACTVNGDVSVEYSNDPTGESVYQTINGDIEVLCSKKLSATIGFESMNGEMFTDFDEVTYLPAKLKKETQKKGGKTTYKIDYDESFRIGKGENKMSFKTLNGDVFLKKL